MQTTYADTLLNIAVTGHLVRIDLGTVVPASSQDGKKALRATPTQQLVMPLEGFLHAFGMQEKVIKQLVKDGVLKKETAMADPSAHAPQVPSIDSNTPQ